jgi:hypothetical protein
LALRNLGTIIDFLDRRGGYIGRLNVRGLMEGLATIDLTRDGAAWRGQQNAKSGQMSGGSSNRSTLSSKCPAAFNCDASSAAARCELIVPVQQGRAPTLSTTKHTVDALLARHLTGKVEAILNRCVELDRRYSAGRLFGISQTKALSLENSRSVITSFIKATL